MFCAEVALHQLVLPSRQTISWFVRFQRSYCFSVTLLQIQ